MFFPNDDDDDGVSNPGVVPVVERRCRMPERNTPATGVVLSSLGVDVFIMLPSGTSSDEGAPTRALDDDNNNDDDDGRGFAKPEKGNSTPPPSPPLLLLQAKGLLFRIAPPINDSADGISRRGGGGGGERDVGNDGASLPSPAMPSSPPPRSSIRRSRVVVVVVIVVVVPFHRRANASSQCIHATPHANANALRNAHIAHIAMGSTKARDASYARRIATYDISNATRRIRTTG